MFIYEKIPDVSLKEITNRVHFNRFKNLPEKLIDFCKAVDSDPDFYHNHYSTHPSCANITRFHNQVYGYLESIGAVRYSVNDDISNTLIQRPLAITFYARQRKPYARYTVKDIGEIYMLSSGRVALPPHHEAKVTEFGKIPETVAVILREYIRYVLKCDDKDFNELQKELITLSSANVIDVGFYENLSKEMDIFNSAKSQTNYQPSEKE